MAHGNYITPPGGQRCQKTKYSINLHRGQMLMMKKQRGFQVRVYTQPLLSYQLNLRTITN